MKIFFSCTAVVLILLIVTPAVAEDIIPNDTTKTIIMHFNIKNDTITFLDARVIYGHPPNNPDIPAKFTVKMLAANDRQIKKFGMPDPRITFLDEGYSFTDDINFSVKVPLSMDLDSVGIYDAKTGMLLARGDTKDIIADFCTSHPRDPDCSPTSPTPAPGFSAGIVVLSLGAILMVGLTRR